MEDNAVPDVDAAGVRGYAVPNAVKIAFG